MPRIPTYVAPEGATVPQYGAPPHALPFPVAAGLGPGVAEVGQRITDIQDRISLQEADAEATALQANYDAAIKRLKNGVFQGGPEGEPAPTDPKQAFYDAARKIQSDLAKDIKHPGVKVAFARHIDKTFPDEIVDVDIRATKERANASLADLHTQGDQFSRIAGEALSEKDRNVAMRTYNDLLDRALSRKIITPDQHQALGERFEQKTIESNMQFLRRTDPDQMWQANLNGAFDRLDPNKRTAILSAATADEERRAAKEHKNFTEAKRLSHEEVSALANQGLVPESTMEQILKGQHPYITAEQGRSIKTINDNPPLGGKIGVLAIMQDYHGGSPSMERIKAARSSLHQYQSGLDRPDVNLDKAFNELQSDERAAESAARGERATRAAELNANIQRAMDAVKEGAVWMPSVLGAMQKATTEADKASIRNLMRDGMPWDKAVQEQEKIRREQNQQRQPGKTKQIIDMVNP